MKTIKSINPYNGKEVASYSLYTAAKIEEIITKANNEYSSYRTSSFSSRRDKLMALADLLEQKKQSLANIIVEEMGKVYNDAVSEVSKCAWVCRYYAKNGEQMLANEIIQTDATKSYISYSPMGIILAVMPWNYPFWQVFRYAAPTLMAGNVCLLKHASNVTGCALAIESIIRESGFEDGCFSTIVVKSDKIADIISDPRIKAVTLTGSGPAGSSVAEHAGKSIKPSVLELGGNDAYIVLADADLDLAADQCTISRLLNTGQSCIGAKRFIIVEEVYDTFLKKFTEAMSKSKMGDPKTEVDLGPMARYDLREEVHQQVRDSIAKGATLHLGGIIPNGEGAFYPPTILTEVAVGMPAYHEEIFGPVASVIKVKDETEAIRVANDSKFGLGACIFSRDIAKAEKMAAEEIEAGACFVNQFVKSDPRLPFGGIKESGYGRELSYYGIKEFVNIKTVYIK